MRGHPGPSGGDGRFCYIYYVVPKYAISTFTHHCDKRKKEKKKKETRMKKKHELVIIVKESSNQGTFEYLKPARANGHFPTRVENIDYV